MKISRPHRMVPAVATLAALLAIVPGCQRSGGESEEAAGADTPTAEEQADAAMPAVVAIAELEGLAGSGVSGRVHFTASDGGRETAILADVTGLAPGEHGFHVHENGDCGDGGKAAGGHFNPGGHPHGSLTDAESHAGDLGNLEAGDDGAASKSIVTNKLSIGTGGANDIVGRAVIVHEKADDLASQPTGAAGGRIACGIVKLQGS